MGDEGEEAESPFEDAQLDGAIEDGVIYVLVVKNLGTTSSTANLWLTR